MNRSRILVVDDEPGMLHAVERVLGASYDIVALRSSRAALATAKETRPDLAIIDIRMPDLDGFELMAQLKADAPELQIILMTGSIDDLDEKLVRALRSPAFYFIQKPFDREVLKTLVERCLELQWRRDEHRRQLQRLETEMAEARAFQQSLLPAQESVVNGVSISCRYTPWRGMGGDLYDYAAAGPGRTALLVADVSGHGVSAAMLTGVVKSAFHGARAEGFEPLSVTHRVWNALAAFGPERFVTLVAALVAPAEGQLWYVNAGHPACVVWGNERAPVWMASTGPLVSPVLPAAWDVETVAVRPSDRILLYTDGVSDVLADSDGDATTELAMAIEREDRGGSFLLDAIVEDVHRRLGGGPQLDDLTMLTATVGKDG
jgi:sigma-B regulation protein RsbU (phosphoserine phosphatase)